MGFVKSNADESKEEVVYSNEEEEEEKEEEEEETKMISVKVKKGENGVKDEEICMKIDREIELRWLMIHYCDKVGLDYRNTKFLFNGARLRHSDTPHRLSMLDDDVIFVFPNSNYQGVNGRTAVCYETLCIRMHKQRDTFLRVTRTQPLLRQLQRHFSSGAGKNATTCFVYNGVKLTEDHTVEKLNMEDGDIIDAFNFADSSSSLSIFTPDRPLITLKVCNTLGKVHYLRATGRTSLSRLVERYAELVSWPSYRIHLIFDGRRLHLDQTVDGSVIDACMNLIG